MLYDDTKAGDAEKGACPAQQRIKFWQKFALRRPQETGHIKKPYVQSVGLSSVFFFSLAARADQTKKQVFRLMQPIAFLVSPLRQEVLVAIGSRLACAASLNHDPIKPLDRAPLPFLPTALVIDGL